MRALVALAVVALAGCYQVRFTRRAPAEPLPRSDEWNHTLVNGLWSVSDPTDLHRICPHGFARVENEQTVVNALAQGLVQSVVGGVVSRASAAGGSSAGVGFQVWHPTTVRVWCAKEKAPSAPPVVERPPPVVLSAPLSVALLPVIARTGVQEAEAELFTDSLANELRRIERMSVVTRSDLAAVLDVEQQKQLLGCEEGACLAELGGALGVDRIVHGTVGRIGASLVVNLFSTDPVSGRTLGSVSERLRSDSNEAFFDALPGLVRGLLAREAGEG